MKQNNYLQKYADHFNYKEIPTEAKNKKLFFKKTTSGFLVIEKTGNDKYVNFYYNQKQKTFKESDLILSIMEGLPIAWNEEVTSG